jgi:hypothetical protein
MSAAACSKVPVVTATLDLPLELRERCCLIAAEMALDNNSMVVLVSQTAQGEMLICAEGDSCCASRPRSVAVVSDTEALSRWGSAPKGAMSVSRADGRTAYVFQGGAR